MATDSAPPQVRLTDVIGVGVLTAVVGRDLVDEVLAETGAVERRSRLLPARVVVYYVLACTLFFGEAYEEVMRRLVGGLMFLRGWSGEWRIPSNSAICQARVRLGAEPMRRLFERVAVPIAPSGAATAFYAGFRVMAVDGVRLDVADTVENTAAFGRSGGATGPGPFPQVLVVGLAECGSRAVVAAGVGASNTPERELMLQVLPALDARMLVLADRGFWGYQHWIATAATGAQLLWRTRNNTILPVLQAYPDGSYRSVIQPPGIRSDIRRGWRKAAPEGSEVPVRVIEYTVTDRGEPELIRLVTSLRDHRAAPAVELAELYHRRWDFEVALDEIKTHQMGPARTLRSKSPELVRQEIWALLLTHYAIRHLIWQAGDDIDTDHDRLSFIRTLRLVRREVTDQAGLSPLHAEDSDQPGPD